MLELLKTTMFCTQCGNRIEEGERFCTRCGTRAPLPAPASSGAAVVKPIVEAPRPNAVNATDSLNTGVGRDSGQPVDRVATPAHAADSQPSEPSAQPFRMFGVEFEEKPPAAVPPPVVPPPPPAVAVEPPPLAPSSGDVAPVVRTSSGLGAAFWFAAFVVVVLGAIGFLAWTMLSSRASRVSVRVDPPSVQLKAGGTTTLSATVAGDPDAAVTWSVMEGASAGFVRSTGVTASGGKVAASAEYLAPLKPGTYHVLAVSNKDKRQASSAEIVVSP